ncbi:MAG: C1 family peptidase [Candidatus Sericytochromatia bacterium]|nr:C1 family peptidase [Candidatus Sericytochromatia bacterium]
MLRLRSLLPITLTLALGLAGCGQASQRVTGALVGAGSLEAQGAPRELRHLKTPIGMIVAGLLPEPGNRRAKEDVADVLSVEEQDLLGVSIMGGKGRSLPKAVDLRPHFEPVRNQGALGSCSAFAATAVMEAMHHLHGKRGAERLSPLFFYYAERQAMEQDGVRQATRKDTGAFMSLAAATAVKIGAAPEKLVPYADGKEGLGYDATAAHFEAAEPHRLKKKARIKTLQGMKAALAAKKPFLLPIILYDSFMTREVAKTGLMPMPGRREAIQGGHAVVAVGYDDEKQAFLIRNSWGTDWGYKGHFWMPYAFFTSSYVGSYFYGECWTLE